MTGRAAGGRRSVAAVLALLVVLLGAACSSGGDGARPAPPATTRRPTTTEPPATTTTVALPAPVPLAWSRCAGRFQCATLTVPVDYADPGGPTLQLAVTRRPAGDPAHRVGTLIVNPGGPGASGVRRVQRGFEITPEVAERFDIVGFDPRGVGRSTPVTCGSTVPAFRAADLGPDTPEEQTALEAAARAVADECAATEGVRLAHLGTVEVAHDLEVLRRDLGDGAVSFVGLSYGTAIGLLWAEAYPASVRAMVLDGVVDPAADGTRVATDQLQALDATLEAIGHACAASADGCPVSGAGGVAHAYDLLATRVEAGAGRDEGVGPTQLAEAFFYATYGEEHWPAFWSALADGLAGRYGDLWDQARAFDGLTAYAPFALVSCLDEPHPLGAVAWRADARRAARISPRFGAVLSNELLPCAFWPQSTYDPHTVRAPGTPPVLVVGSTGDVATPYDQAVGVARALARGVLLTVDLDGHVAIGASDCADAAITRYLVDGTAPAPGTRC